MELLHWNIYILILFFQTMQVIMQELIMAMVDITYVFW
jgi:hypothetical protein